MERVKISPRTERTHAALDRMMRTMRLHHKVIEQRFEGLGVHHSQHRMLMHLSRLGPMPSQKDFAGALGVSPACVARTLKSLSAAGLIDRAEGADGRCREIALLPAGQKLVEDSVKTFSSIEAEMFEGISDEDIAHMTDIMSRLYQNLCKMEKPEGGDRP